MVSFKILGLTIVRNDPNETKPSPLLSHTYLHHRPAVNNFINRKYCMQSSPPLPCDDSLAEGRTRPTRREEEQKEGKHAFTVSSIFSFHSFRNIFLGDGREMSTIIETLESINLRKRDTICLSSVTVKRRKDVTGIDHPSMPKLLGICFLRTDILLGSNR